MSKHSLEDDEPINSDSKRTRIVLDVTHVVNSNVRVLDPIILQSSHIVWKDETTPVADLRTLFGKLQAYEPGLTDEIERMTAAIPDQVITHGQFEGNTDLISFKFPKMLKSIGLSAFKGCINLVRVDLSECTLLTEIYQDTFAECTSLVSVVLPPNCTIIYSSAFNACRMLETVELPDGLRNIEVDVFRSCLSLQSISLPPSLRYLGDGAFRSSGVLRIHIPPLVETIVSYTFDGCLNLGEVITHDTFKTIEDNAFQGCTRLTHVEVGGIVQIGENAFKHCSSLKHITLPLSVTYLGRAAFAFSGLTHVHIPKSLDRIRDFSFGHCHNLRDVTIDMDSELSRIDELAFSGTPLHRFTGNRKLEFIWGDAFIRCELLDVLDLTKCAQLTFESWQKVLFPPRKISQGALVLWPRQADNVLRGNRGKVYKEVALTDEQWETVNLETVLQI